MCYRLSDVGDSAMTQVLDERPDGGKNVSSTPIPSPESNSPEIVGRKSESDRQERYGTQPRVHGRHPAIAVGESAPEVRAPEAPDHQGRRQITRVETCTPWSCRCTPLAMYVDRLLLLMIVEGKCLDCCWASPVVSSSSE